MNPWVLAGTSFLASLVEAVEAVTIVLAVGYTHGWRAALSGAAWASLTLAAIVGIFGPALLKFVPLGWLELVVGLFLTLFGFTWLRKAVWRYGGRKALHDEEAIFEREVAMLRARHERRVGFLTSYNAVLLEGLEIAVIVITFAAASATGIIWATGGAVAAAVAVIAAGVLLRKPFANVPENTMKFFVGIMLLSLGTFWAGEGLGVTWIWGNLTLLVITLSYAALSGLLAALERRRYGGAHA